MIALAVVAVLIVALAGRFTPGRAGVPLGGADLPDLRLLGLAVCVTLAAAALAGRRQESRPREARLREGWLVAALLGVGYQLGSVLWAPSGARVGDKSLDLAVLAALTLTFYLLARAAPLAVARVTAAFLLVAGLAFGVGALVLTGPGAQGRYAAFGGGPNVFVRIEVLGVIAAIALYRLTRRRALLAAVPFLGVMALLSGSRGGLIAALAVAVVALLRSPVPKARIALAAAATGGLAIALIPAVQTRLIEQTVEQGYSSGRGDIWASAAGLAWQHPLLGAGLDGFYGLIGRVSGVEYPHNYLLGLAAEGGLAALGLLATTAVLWLRTVRGAAARPELALAVAGVAFIAVDSMFSGDYYDTRFGWLLAGLAAAVAAVPAESVRLRALPGGGRHSGGVRTVALTAVGDRPVRGARHAAVEVRR